MLEGKNGAMSPFFFALKIKYRDLKLSRLVFRLYLGISKVFAWQVFLVYGIGRQVLN